ncbi:hypothetical protein AOL_s00054g809 [Orbilia oligospora ATCC 24927]|uniref:Uncharacterized protein n=1 Tax=Arthrobotrys oligospora (strain ATCC 24927 / CBS 115.81 / DSM 1491) TaxID=756982 RepID=G1X7G5_ARTOA|nr:hypothetical protein AOL_s00054g809 [Orbilia oligospora ATCC 24927]EGX51073.1 hypothetical protein AOL_s00054g809 [Orbilia oligospora ATCC 24927]
MTTMLKRILKGRNQTSKESPSPLAYNSYGFGNSADDRTVGTSFSTSSAMSAAPVDYRTSPPDVHTTSSSMSVAPAEYGEIRPDIDPSMFNTRAQRSPLRPYSGGQFPPLPEYNQSAPRNQYDAGNEHQYEVPTPGSLVSPAAVDYTRGPLLPQSPYSHELESPPISTPAAVSYSPAYSEMYGSINAQVHPPPQRPPQQYASYGNPGENVANQRPPYNYQEHNYAPPSPSTPKYVHQNEAQRQQLRFENAYPESGNSSASSLYSQPFSSVSNSTAPTSVYSPDRPNFVPNTPNTPNTPNAPKNPNIYADSTTPSADDPNVSKFAVRLFCQRKRKEEDTHEEIPRDIREFRIANLALIKLEAGGERYVLLDAVFGELDKAIAPLLEKHWYLTLNTKIEDHYVSGGKHVVAIGNIMVAYKGTQSTLYADFRKDDDYTRFKLEMEYAMNTIRNSNNKSSSPKNEKQLASFPEKQPRYRY